MIKGQRILLTGGEGFVGKYFQRELKKGKNAVHVVDVVKGDNHELRRFLAANPTARYDIVIHLAAVVGGRAQIEGDPLSVAVDLEIDAALFRWAETAKPGRIVYFSSSAAYPIHLQQRGSTHLLVETDIDLSAMSTPDLTYGWSKLTGEFLAQFSGVPVHIVRPFSGYGTDQDLAYPFPSFIRRALQQNDPFQIWGDGTQVRDFVHMDDVVATVLEMIEQDHRGPLNIGTGRATSFNDLAKLVTDGVYEPRIQHLEAKPSGVHFRVADVTEMNKLRPARITLEEGIARALQRQL